MLMHCRAVAVTFVVFDLLSLDGRSGMRLPYSERRAELEGAPVKAPTGRRQRHSMMALHCSRLSISHRHSIGHRLQSYVSSSSSSPQSGDDDRGQP